MYHEILPPSTHAQKEITCSKSSLHLSEQFYMHKNTSACVLIVWELIELTEYCHLLKKGSESALDVRRCTTKFSPPSTHAQKEITCSKASLHPSEQFYMHKNTSASTLIVWGLIELTEYCHLLKNGSESALEVRRCTTKFSPPSTHAQKEITCSKASLHPSEQFYMHKNTSESVLIV